jgi:hypothetical protein
MDLRKRLAERFRQAGPVVPFSPKKPSNLKPHGPVETIHGRKYVLSDFWPMGAEIADMASPEGEAGGAKLIDTGGNRFRYLWVFDTDRKILTMWRHSDGDEKYSSHENSAMRDIFALEKKRQLNRVTHEEFQQVDREMKKRSDATLKSLKQWAKENESDLEKEASQILRAWFDRNIRPSLERRFSELDKGVVPFGFKVNPNILQYRSEKRQARQWLLTKALEGFDQAAAYTIVSKAVGYDAYDPPNGGDAQAVQWAWADFIENVVEELGD